MKKERKEKQKSQKSGTKTTDKSAGEDKFPKKVEPNRPIGFHGTDNEKNLNPEE